MSLRVLMLADIYSEHTEKWALGLAAKGIHVGLFSFNRSSYEWYKNNENITLLFEPKKSSDANLKRTKLNYLFYLGSLKKAIKKFQPDILHAHYASSYGLLGSLSGFHPFIISSWGTDVMKFPYRNRINQKLLRYNFKKADVLCATSNTIKAFALQVQAKKVEVVPFGVNLNEFKAKPVKSIFGENDFVIGCVKALEKIYNIDVLIKAFAQAHAKHKNMKLLLVGEGSQHQQLVKLCDELKITESVTFTGRIKFSDVSNYFNMINVLVNVSDYESFGVSVIEAMACEKPVVVSSVGGLKEIVENSNAGILVPVGDVNETANAIEKYYLDKDLRISSGQNGRKKVEAFYNWENNLNQMIEIYNKAKK